MARFQPGRSGNPAGRPKGSPDRRTQMTKLLGEQTKTVAERVLSACLNDNDMTACKAILDRTVPKMRDKAEPIAFELDAKAPLTEQANQIMQSIAQGDIDPGTGRALIDGIAGLVRVREIDELTERLDRLEAMQDERNR